MYQFNFECFQVKKQVRNFFNAKEVQPFIRQMIILEFIKLSNYTNKLNDL